MSEETIVRLINWGFYIGIISIILGFYEFIKFIMNLGNPEENVGELLSCSIISIICGIILILATFPKF